MSIARSVFWIALCSIFASHRADADEPRVRIELACDGLRLRQLYARLALELPGSERAARKATQVRVTCDAGTITLTVEDPLTRKSLSRSFALDGKDAELRERVVGIAIAELVAASWIELEVNPIPRATPLGPSPAPADVADALSSLDRRGFGSRLRVSALASTQVFFSGAGALFGGGVRLAADPRRHFGWAVDVLAHHGEVQTSLGEVAIETITAGGAALGRKDWTHVSVHGGAGVRLGTSVLRGLAAGGAAVNTDRVTWIGGGPFGTFAVEVFPVRGLVIELAAEGGYWIFPTGGLVNGRREVALDGPFVGAQAGIGIVL